MEDEIETEECKHQPVCFCDENEMEYYEVEYWQNTRYWVRVEAASEEEAIDFVESWDTTKVDFADAQPTDADHPENARLI